jgi:hypothetical protein
MSTQYLIDFLQQTQFHFNNTNSKQLREVYDNSSRRIQYVIPTAIPDNCSVEIGYLDLEARSIFRHGQWTSPHKKDKLAMKKRTFKNINLNNTADLTMLNNYFSVVKERAIPAFNFGVTHYGKEVNLAIGSWCNFISPNRKDLSKGTLHLHYEFSLRIHSPLNHDFENLSRASVRISFPVSVKG